MSDKSDALKAELRSKTRSVYMVNEKMPTYGYDRKWKLHVLWHDGTVRDYVGHDSEQGKETILQEALWDLVRAS